MDRFPPLSTNKTFTINEQDDLFKETDDKEFPKVEMNDWFTGLEEIADNLELWKSVDENRNNTQRIHNNCEARPSTSFPAPTTEKCEMSLEEKLQSLTNDKDIFMASVEDTLKKRRLESQITSSKASNIKFSPFLPGNKSSSSGVVEVSQDTTVGGILFDLRDRSNAMCVDVKENIFSTKHIIDVAGSFVIPRKPLKQADKRILTCDMCFKVFQLKSEFNRHYLTHLSEKPFECYVCKKRFTEKRYLKRHYITHNAEKTFVCDVCNIRFRLEGNLNEHQRTHSGEKPFVCDVCTKGFVEKTTLNTH